MSSMSEPDIIQMPCDPSNCGGLRAPIKYIVMHYTAGHNDTAVNNGTYFANNHVGASAHYFVDSENIVQSVPDNRVAWHCGGSFYYHPECRNYNSIGVEICTRYDNGEYWFDPAAVDHAKELARFLMKKYSIDQEHVIRHFDVTHKICPAPMCGEHHDAWLEFKEDLMRYNTIEDVPSWGKKTIEKLTEKELLQGGDDGLDLSHDLLRTLVILDRAKLFDK